MGHRCGKAPESQTTVTIATGMNSTNRASGNKLSAVEREQSARLHSPLRKPLKRCDPQINRKDYAELMKAAQEAVDDSTTPQTSSHDRRLATPKE